MTWKRDAASCSRWRNIHNDSADVPAGKSHRFQIYRRRLYGAREARASASVDLLIQPRAPNNVTRIKT